MSQCAWVAPRDSAPKLFPGPSSGGGTEIAHIFLGLDGAEYKRPYTSIKERIWFNEAGISDQRVETYKKAFEFLGLLYVDDGTIRLTPAGRQITFHLQQLSSGIAPSLLRVLSRYQLKNPTATADGIPEDCDIKPFWAIWKAMRSLDNKLSHDELLRVILKLRRMDELPAAIAKIKQARTEEKYEPKNHKLAESLFGAVGTESPQPETVASYWFSLAGFGGLIIESESRKDSYRYLSPLVFAQLDDVLKEQPPYYPCQTASEWFQYYGAEVVGAATTRILHPKIGDQDAIFLKCKELIDKGSPGIIFSGPPGTSKTWYAEQVALRLAQGDNARIWRIQFHPSYSYEDFIEGYVPKESASGVPVFKIEDKVFVKACLQARENYSRPVVVVIDEITRGDPARIFGELLTYIERRDDSFILPISGREFSIPRNMVILGTMNPEDRSVTELDVALERRFDTIEMEPSVGILEQILTASGMQKSLIEKTKVMFGTLIAFEGIRIGHAYFVHCKDENDLRNLWNNKLLGLA